MFRCWPTRRMAGATPPICGAPCAASSRPASAAFTSRIMNSASTRRCRKCLASCEQMVQKIAAARDARSDPNFLIIARTDAAWALRDVEEAVRRLNAFSAAGADLVMAPGLDPATLAPVRARIHGKIVTVDTPGRSAAEEERAGA